VISVYLVLLALAFVPFLRIFGRRTAFSAGFLVVAANNHVLAEGALDRLLALPLFVVAAPFFREGVPSLLRWRALAAVLLLAAVAALDPVAFIALVVTVVFIRERKGSPVGFLNLLVTLVPAAMIAMFAHESTLALGSFTFDAPWDRLIDIVQTAPPLWGLGVWDLLLSWALLAFILGGIVLENVRARRRRRTLDLETRRLPVLLPAVVLFVVAIGGPRSAGAIEGIPERLLLFVTLLLIPLAGIAARLFKNPNGFAFLFTILCAAAFAHGCNRSRNDLDRALAAAPALPRGASFLIWRDGFRPVGSGRIDPTLHADCRYALERDARHIGHRPTRGGGPPLELWSRTEVTPPDDQSLSRVDHVIYLTSKAGSLPAELFEGRLVKLQADAKSPGAAVYRKVR
jgi:hypothetical protein